MKKHPEWLNNDKIRECFNSLPKVAQESIMQSTNGFNSAEDLIKFSENLTGKNNVDK